MTALRNEEVSVHASELTSDDMEPAQSSQRGAQALINFERAPLHLNRQRLDYTIVHAVPGRLRLKVKNLRFDFDQASTCLARLAVKEGITGVRCNCWCYGAVVEYDRKVWSQEQLLEVLEQLTYGDSENNEPAPLVQITVKPNAIGQISHFFSVVETLLPPWLQVSLGVLSFSSAILKLPFFVSKVLLAISTAPIAFRALRTALVERKMGIDALDGAAASVMLVNGKFIEAGLMTALIGIGEFIRERTTRRCEKMVSDLLGLSGRSAWLIRGSKRVCVAADEVKVGDTVVVYPGDMVPVDGVVTGGEAAIDQSKLTGEAIPVEVRSGATVFASTVLVEGKIYVRCEATGSETKAGQVLQCVENAPIHETKIQNYASAIADKAVVPIFFAATICFAITRDVSRLMSMLILDFCTGIRIAAPTAVLSSMHRAGRRGILIKSGAALEKLASVTAIVFDKTGTLTSGEPKVEAVSRFNGHTEEEILAFAAAVEMRLHHPAARAIVKAAQQQGLTIPERTTSKFLRGLGAKAIVGTHEVLVGSKNLMTSEGIIIEDARESELCATKLGESFAYVAIDGKVAGLIRYSDRLRPEVISAIRQLKRLRVKKLVMATGDIEQAANKIAAKCGIDEVIARAFPEDKAKLVQRLKSEGHIVAVIGDGINDSPALAYADVAISLHGATDAAQQSADIILTDDNLERLPEAIRIARSAMALVQQNLAMAVIPNAGGFAMAGLGLLGPAGATILNNGSAITAAINSLRPLYSSTWSQVEPIEKSSP